MSGIGMGGFGKLPRPQEIRTCERETEASTGQGCGDPTCPICMPSNPRDRGGGKVGGGNGNPGRGGMDMNEMARRLAASREASMGAGWAGMFSRPFETSFSIDTTSIPFVTRNDAPSSELRRVIDKVNEAYGNLGQRAAMDVAVGFAVEAKLDRNARQTVYAVSRMPAGEDDRFHMLCEARMGGMIPMPPGDMGMLRALLDKKRSELAARGVSEKDQDKAIRQSLKDRGFSSEQRDAFMAGPRMLAPPASVDPETATKAAARAERERVARTEREAKARAQQDEQRLRPKVEKFFLKTAHAISWDDVVGNEEARTALVEAIEDPVRHKELYAHYGKRPTKGVLLYGPPGCGKTMFGKAAASVLATLHGRSGGEHTMLHIKGPEIQSPYVGVTEEVVRDVFAYASAYKRLHGYPLVVFIDEADAILPSRDGNGTTRRALPWEESNVATFLTEMDGLEDSGALVILATNRPNSIDAAILRDGRCDRKIRVERPNRDAARTIVANCLRGAPLHDTDADTLAEAMADAVFSPACRLANLRHAGGVTPLTLGDITNGAMIAGLVDRAKGIAFRRDLAAGGAPSGITTADAFEAVKATLKTNEGLAHADAIREVGERHGWSEVAVEKVTPKPTALAA